MSWSYYSCPYAPVVYTRYRCRRRGASGVGPGDRTRTRPGWSLRSDGTGEVGGTGVSDLGRPSLRRSSGPPVLPDRDETRTRSFRSFTLVETPRERQTSRGRPCPGLGRGRKSPTRSGIVRSVPETRPPTFQVGVGVG